MNIQLANTDDLIEELLNRHEHAVFMGIKLPKENDVISVRRWRGNTYTCCGLCDSLTKHILDDYECREEPIGKEDY